MLDMVTPEDLDDNQEYGGIYKDAKQECSRYGAAEGLYIRPVKKDKTKFVPETRGSSTLDAQPTDEATGVGLVYAKLVGV